MAPLLVLALVLALAAPANANGGTPDAKRGRSAVMPRTLLDAARANPNRVFDVIVQGRGRGSRAVANAVRDALLPDRGKASGVKRQFTTIDGVAAELTGAQILGLSAKKDILSITRDDPLVASGDSSGSSTCTCAFEGLYWPYLAGVNKFWPSPSKKAAPVPQAPAIAVVDSGIDASNAFFGGRVVKQVTFASLTPNSPGDGNGHGTFVAGLAAGQFGNWGGASPTSKIVSLDVINDEGKALTSDVISAADWIYQNKDAYGIRVANFSLTGTHATTFMYDPLDRAVEKLWLSGVVVVATAGNHGSNGAASSIDFAPGNDPFVITVGSIDMNETSDPSDDFVAPWSAFGYTPDGFAKPELSAPGRYMIGTVPTSATMPLLRPDRVIATGWMWMSGTSFAAPVVAGAAADVLAVHPSWTPDQVKGALMVSAQPIRVGPAWSGGVGQVKADAAAAVADPPNPNLALNQFLRADPSGGPTPVFDAASWLSTAATDPAWATAAWTSAAWTSAAWTSAAWTSAAWTSAAWTSAAWTSAAWTSDAQTADVQLSLQWLP